MPDYRHSHKGYQRKGNIMQEYYIQECSQTVIDSTAPWRRTVESYYIVRRTADNHEMFLTIHRASAEATLAHYLGETL